MFSISLELFPFVNPELFSVVNPELFSVVTPELFSFVNPELFFSFPDSFENVVKKYSKHSAWTWSFRPGHGQFGLGMVGFF